MTAPEIRTETRALLDDASKWASGSLELGETVAKVDDMRITRIEAGIFQTFYGSYMGALGQVADRMTEGVQRMPQVANALDAAAEIYEGQELHYKHEIKSLDQPR